MPQPEPMHFVIGLADFDLELLPDTARIVGSDAFQAAVREYYASEFAELGGVVSVDFMDDAIEVIWQPKEGGEDAFDRAIMLLERGDYREAVPILQALVAVDPTNALAHYNLGMALSDLGRMKDAQLHLLKVVHLEPDNSNALVALGVALYRNGDLPAARRRLERALALDPENGYAHRNLAAVMGNLEEGPESIAHFREAYRLLPTEQQSTFGLARALDEFGGADHKAEADDLYRATIKLDPDTDIAELARQARSQTTQKLLRSPSGGPRMDAVMYCLGALQRFAAMRPEEVQGVGFEIALLGQRGLEVMDPSVTYTLRTLPGTFTGMQLTSMMYVAFKQVAPQLDIGFDLAAEYEAALQLHALKS